jgi:hypothetical protein
MKLMEKEGSKFSIKFDSKAHEIDAGAYGSVLVNTVALVDEVTNELEGFGKFKINVTAERKGSYIVDLTMQAGAALGLTSQMITADNSWRLRRSPRELSRHWGRCLK